LCKTFGYVSCQCITTEGNQIHEQHTNHHHPETPPGRPSIPSEGEGEIHPNWHASGFIDVPEGEEGIRPKGNQPKRIYPGIDPERLTGERNPPGRRPAGIPPLCGIDFL